MQKNLDKRWRKRTILVLLVYGAILLAVWIGCRSTEIVITGERITHLEEGEPAPHAGYLIEDAVFIRVYEAAEKWWAQEEEGQR